MTILHCSLLDLYVLRGLPLLVVPMELIAPAATGNRSWQHEDRHLVLPLLDCQLGG